MPSEDYRLLKVYIEARILYANRTQSWPENIGMNMNTLMQKEKHRRIRLALSILFMSMSLVVLAAAEENTLGEAFKEVNASVF